MQSTPVNYSLFPIMQTCPEIEIHIFSFLPNRDLYNCAKVSKVWCWALDSLGQNYLDISKVEFKNTYQITPLLSHLLYSHDNTLNLDDIGTKKELESLANAFFLGFYANLILFRINQLR
jgi:hypothetical protein